MATEQQTFDFTGQLMEIEHRTTKKNQPWIRALLTDPIGRGWWFSIFKDPIMKMMNSQGVNSGPWSLTYYERKYPDNTGQMQTGYTVTQANIAATQQAQQAPPQQAQPQQTPPQQTEQTPYTPGPVPNWAVTIDDRGRSIIRQVAFKEIEHKDDKSLETIAELVDEYERIILGTFDGNAEFLAQGDQIYG